MTLLPSVKKFGWLILIKIIDKVKCEIFSISGVYINCTNSIIGREIVQFDSISTISVFKVFQTFKYSAVDIFSRLFSRFFINSQMYSFDFSFDSFQELLNSIRSSKLCNRLWTSLVAQFACKQTSSTSILQTFGTLSTYKNK